LIDSYADSVKKRKIENYNQKIVKVKKISQLLDDALDQEDEYFSEKFHKNKKMEISNILSGSSNVRF